MALTTTAKFKTYCGITVSTYDTLIDDLLLRAQSEIEKYCDRNFDSATYREFYSGDGTSELTLNQYPVTAVKLLAVDSRDAFSIINTSSDAYNATVSVNDTQLVLSVSGGANAGDSTLTLSTYTSMTLLAAAITALNKGWTVSVLSATASWSAIELLPTKRGMYCHTIYAYPQIPDTPETDYSIDANSGVIKLFGTFFTGYDNVVVRYTAGYSSIPAALEQICIELMKAYYDSAKLSFGLAGENIGSYSYTVLSNEESKSALTETSPLGRRLNAWKKYKI